MATSVRIDLDGSGIRSLLRDSSLIEDAVNEVASRAEGLAAGIMVDGEPGSTSLPVTSEISTSGSRARGYVTVDHPAGMAVEAKHRVLGSAAGG